MVRIVGDEIAAPPYRIPAKHPWLRRAGQGLSEEPFHFEAGGCQRPEKLGLRRTFVLVVTRQSRTLSRGEVFDPSRCGRGGGDKTEPTRRGPLNRSVAHAFLSAESLPEERAGCRCYDATSRPRCLEAPADPRLHPQRSRLPKARNETLRSSAVYRVLVAELLTHHSLLRMDPKHEEDSEHHQV